MSGALKDNTALEKGVLTGILRTAEESIFSGLNNLSVYTILDQAFSDKFGFTQPEVNQLLQDYKLEDKKNDIAHWYNGYKFSGLIIYNPWSLMKCAESNGALDTYWANTSDNSLIKKTLLRASGKVQSDLEKLLAGVLPAQEIENSLTFTELDQHNDTAVWSLLVLSGYLTPVKQEFIDARWICDLKIPNNEVLAIYQKFLRDYLQASLRGVHTDDLLPALQQGNGEILENILKSYIINSMSSHDLDSNEPEKSYHLFILGLLVTYSHVYIVKSNRESGTGRYDIMLTPKDPKQRGLLIEFKKAKSQKELSVTAQDALKQIHKQHYIADLKQQDIAVITLFGIAFHGKHLKLYQENIF